MTTLHSGVVLALGASVFLGCTGSSAPESRAGGATSDVVVVIGPPEVSDLLVERLGALGVNVTVDVGAIPTSGALVQVFDFTGPTWGAFAEPNDYDGFRGELIKYGHNEPEMYADDPDLELAELAAWDGLDNPLDFAVGRVDEADIDPTAILFGLEQEWLDILDPGFLERYDLSLDFRTVDQLAAHLQDEEP